MTTNSAPLERKSFGSSQVRLVMGGAILGVATAGIVAAASGVGHRETIELVGAIIGGVLSAVAIKYYNLA